MCRRHNALTTFLTLGLLFTTTGTPAATYQAWETLTDRDEMEGTAAYYVVTESKNRLDGWLRSGNLVLGYDCQTDGLYLRANGLGFEAEDSEISNGVVYRWSHVRAKVDDGEVKRGRFQIWEDNNDGMTLDRIQGQTRGLVAEMKSGTELMVEVTLFNTKGRDQIARFSLMGFTAATKWCDQKTG